MARGKKTSGEQIEAIKSLSVAFSAPQIAVKLGLPKRTVYEVLAREDNPEMQAQREERTQEIVDDVWKDSKKEIMKLKQKADLLLDGITKDKIEKANVRDVTISYGVLTDKKLLLSGRPNQIVGTLTAIIEQAHADKKTKDKDSLGKAAVIIEQGRIDGSKTDE